jgi:hypothetical protein
MKKSHVLIAFGAVLLGHGSADAHHSFAAFFDSTKTVTLTGKVKEFRFTNPHGTIAIEASEEGKPVRLWRAETNAPVVLMRRGWKRDSIKPGDTVTLSGWPARDGKPYFRLQRALDGNGKLIGSAPFAVNED